MASDMEYDISDLLRETSKLKDLLEDPHPDLPTWNSAVARRIETIAGIWEGRWHTEEQ